MANQNGGTVMFTHMVLQHHSIVNVLNNNIMVLKDYHIQVTLKSDNTPSWQ